MKACVATGVKRQIEYREVPMPIVEPGGRQGQNRINGEKSLYMLAHEQMDPTPILTDVMPFRDIQKAIDSTYAGENLAILLTP
jgi:threonine dehydrogenase-like Zn-dependent dehydrogenase